MWWYQGTWYLSKERGSTKLQQSSKNQGLSTNRSRYYQDHWNQKSKRNVSSYRRHRRQSIQIQSRKNRGRTWSTLRFYCKNLRPPSPLTRTTLVTRFGPNWPKVRLPEPERSEG